MIRTVPATRHRPPCHQSPSPDDGWRTCVRARSSVRPCVCECVTAFFTARSGPFVCRPVADAEPKTERPRANGRQRLLADVGSWFSRVLCGYFATDLTGNFAVRTGRAWRVASTRPVRGFSFFYFTFFEIFLWEICRPLLRRGASRWRDAYASVLGRRPVPSPPPRYRPSLRPSPTDRNSSGSQTVGPPSAFTVVAMSFSRCIPCNISFLRRLRL